MEIMLMMTRQMTRSSTVCAILLVAILAIGGGPAIAGRISGNNVNGRGVFLDQTGKIFIPRGINFDRLSPGGYHNVFDPGVYSSSDVKSNLNYIAYSRYNYIRVIISSVYVNTGYGGMTAPGVSPAYLANLQDFLEIAASYNLQVILASDALPANYNSFLSKAPNTELSKIAAPNNPVLNPGFASGMAANFLDIIQKIKIQSPTALSAIMAMEVLNEAYVLPDCAPFKADQCPTDAQGNLVSKPSAQISNIIVSNVSYNMNSDVDRQNLVDVATLNLVQTVRGAIHAIDPTIMVSMGAFTITEANGNVNQRFNGVHGLTGQPGERYPVRPFIIGKYSNADFADVHIYPYGEGWDLGSELSAEEITTSTRLPKPLLMGEFGADTRIYSDLASTARLLSDLQTQSCSYGFIGWSFWNWDTPGQPFWIATEQNGAINGIVSPAGRPNICP